MEPAPVMTATIDPTERKVEAIATKQRTANGYRDKTEHPTRTVLLDTLSPLYRTVRTNLEVVVSLTGMMTSVVRKDSEADSG